MEWRLEEGKIYVSGVGRVAHYPVHSEQQAPWDADREHIKTLIVEEGVTELGVNGFKGCKNLEEIFLPESLTRIHAQCFSGCEKLEKIHTQKEAGYQFIYDKREKETVRTKKKQQIIQFGLKSFYGVPWALEKWGNFYINDGTLFDCFSLEDKIEIPAEVDTIGQLAFSGTNIEQVVFPESLLIIEEVAFEGTGLKKITLPKNLKEIKKGAFARTALELVIVPARADVEIDISAFAHTKIRLSIRDKNSYKKNGVFKLVSGVDGSLKNFKRLGIGIKEGEIGKPVLDGGKDILQRIKRGSIIIGIRYNTEEKLVHYVASMIWNEPYKVPKWYQMYPCYANEEKQRGVEIWSDTITEIEQEDIIYRFYTRNPEKAIMEGSIKCCAGNDFEEWFTSSDKYNFAGPAEIQALEEWLEKHPEYKLQSMDEHRAESKGRLVLGC